MSYFFQIYILALGGIIVKGGFSNG